MLRLAAPSRIVNVGSMFGDIAYPLFAAYSASKFALRGAFDRDAPGAQALRHRRDLCGAAGDKDRRDRRPSMDLVKPLQMRMDDPAVVAAQIWRAVCKDLDSVYAKGAERLFVLVQKFAPEIVDRAIAAQMADPRIRDYLAKPPGQGAATWSRGRTPTARGTARQPDGIRRHGRAAAATKANDRERRDRSTQTDVKT